MNVRSGPPSAGRPAPRLYVVTPAAGDPAALIGALDEMFDAADVAAVLLRLHEALLATLADPTVRTRLHELGSEPVGSTPDEFLAYIRQELPKWGELVKNSGATID